MREEQTCNKTFSRGFFYYLLIIPPAKLPPALPLPSPTPTVASIGLAAGYSKAAWEKTTYLLSINVVSGIPCLLPLFCLPQVDIVCCVLY